MENKIVKYLVSFFVMILILLFILTYANGGEEREKHRRTNNIATWLIWYKLCPTSFPFNSAGSEEDVINFLIENEFDRVDPQHTESYPTIVFYNSEPNLTCVTVYNSD